MSNNHILRPLAVEELQMDHSSNSINSSPTIMQTGNEMNNTTYEISDMPIEPKHAVEQSAVVHTTFQLSDISSEPKLPMEPPVVVHSSGVQPFVSPKQQLGTMGHVLTNYPSIPIKRSTYEPLLLLMKQKVNIPGFQQQPRSKRQKKITPPSDTQNQLSENKKVALCNPISYGKLGSKQVQVPKNEVMQQMESSLKVRNDSSEIVRSKMRESLIAALSLVSLQKSKCLNNEMAPGNNVTLTEEGGQQLEQQIIEKPEISNSLDKPNNDVYITTSPQGEGSIKTWRQGLNVNNENNTPFDDNSFFAKDELLQGNGLTWAYDLPMDVETTANKTIKEEPKLQCPILLASKIEAELFKCYGGVNKKYKEKGRSLLFNLKDPSNPELREKVMLGEINPERLCSMSAEDLASEELSRWRIAKAEELAQMVVLPDSNVMRLVKKTHKGEFEVDVEDDHVVSADVSTAPSSISKDGLGNSSVVHMSSHDNISDKFTIPNDGTDLLQGLMVDGEFKDSDLPPIVSLDEFMESLDTEPPFDNVPLDVKKTASPSLSASPTIKKMTSPTTDCVKDSSKSKTDENSNSDLNAKANDEVKLVTEVEMKKNENEDSKSLISDDGEKKQAAANHSKEGKKSATNIDALWEGSVLMSASSVVKMIGYYKCGEKAVTKKWRSLEVKGRVRLDAFEKFVQELPKSRSRSVMVAHFVLKNDQSEEDIAIINEAVNLYVDDLRLSIAEPEKGIEVYFCPPQPRIKAVITKHLIRNSNETTTIDSVDNGLLAVVVWRKVVVSSNSSSANKHSSKKRPFSPTRRQQVVKQQEPDLKRQHVVKQQDPVLKSKQKPPNMPSVRPVVPLVNKSVIEDDDEDVPPGFGPGQTPTKEDDDLPEFNFSSGIMPSFPTKVINRCDEVGLNASPKMNPPVSQVRELIMKYGQNPSNIPETMFQPWNDDEDDDDDIPEWQPQSEVTNIRPLQTHSIRQQQQPLMFARTNEQLPIWPTIHENDGRWVRQGLGRQLPTSGGGYYGQLLPGNHQKPDDSRNNRG